MGIITLTSDFGTSDSYVAQMKGVLLSINPGATLVDLTHDIPPCDIPKAARILEEAIPLYPAEAVHLAVVDPGVGGARKRLIIRAEVKSDVDAEPKSVWLVGPDNGLFSRIAPPERRLGVWEITELHRLPQFRSGQTFEGRSIFSPAAAHLSMNGDPKLLGRELPKTAPITLELSDTPVKVDGVIQGRVVYFDHFGNAATNVHRSQLGKGKVLISLSRRALTLELRASFEQFGVGQAGCIINSQGYVEIVLNQGSALKRLGLEIGEPCQVSSG